jgi:hypothetical protein
MMLYARFLLELCRFKDNDTTMKFFKALLNSDRSNFIPLIIFVIEFLKQNRR